MKKSILWCLTLLFTYQINAQSDQTLFGSSGIDFTGVWAGNTSNINESDGDYGVFHGGYVFLEFNKFLTVGYQSYGLIEDDLKMKFKGVHLGYAPQSYNVVHPVFNVFAGGGRFKSQLEDGYKDNVFAVQPSLGVEVNVVKWFRLGLEGGYRFVFDTDIPGYTDASVSDPFVGLRLKFGFSWGD